MFLASYTNLWERAIGIGFLDVPGIEVKNKSDTLMINMMHSSQATIVINKHIPKEPSMVNSQLIVSKDFDRAHLMIQLAALFKIFDESRYTV